MKQICTAMSEEAKHQLGAVCSDSSWQPSGASQVTGALHRRSSKVSVEFEPVDIVAQCKI